MFSGRAGFAKQMNENLRQTVVDYFVTVRFREGLLSHELETIIKTELNWRTSQVPRAQLISSNMSPFQLLDAIHKADGAERGESPYAFLRSCYNESSLVAP